MNFEFLIPIFGIMVVLVPVVGVTTVLTLRLGGKPFVETLARELRGTGLLGSGQLEARVSELSEQVEVLTQELARLSDAHAFDERLLREGSGNP